MVHAANEHEEAIREVSAEKSCKRADSYEESALNDIFNEEMQSPI